MKNHVIDFEVITKLITIILTFLQIHENIFKVMCHIDKISKFHLHWQYKRFMKWRTNLKK